MIGRMALWAVLAALSCACFVRAWYLGKDGLDDQQTAKVKNFAEFESSKVWVCVGAALLLYVVYDVFILFNPPPLGMR